MYMCIYKYVMTFVNASKNIISKELQHSMIRHSMLETTCLVHSDLFTVLDICIYI